MLKCFQIALYRVKKFICRFYIPISLYHSKVFDKLFTFFDRILQYYSSPFHARFLSIAHKRAYTSGSGKCALFLFVWIPVKSFADNMPYVSKHLLFLICKFFGELV